MSGSFATTHGLNFDQLAIHYEIKNTFYGFALNIHISKGYGPKHFRFFRFGQYIL